MAVLSEIASGLSIVDWAIKLWSKLKGAKPSDSVASRFIQIFEEHGVHRNQIPRFFGHGLTLADLQDEQILLSKLTDEMLDAACERFAIRREWLDGASDQIHPTHDFYKMPGQFAVFVDDLAAKNPHAELMGVLIAPEETKDHAEALIILQETIGWVGDKPICRFHLCNNWYFSYWKARAYLTACVAIACKRHIYIHGMHKPKAFIDQLRHGETLLGWKGESCWELGHKTWHPEDMTDNPEQFLKGMDPEDGNFGLIAGLELWLELAQQGLMDSYSPAPIERFEQALARYQ